jgi:hypothetical protein
MDEKFEPLQLGELQSSSFHFESQVRLSTSPGYPRLTTGIPMGKPAGMSTRGSESHGDRNCHGSG